MKLHRVLNLTKYSIVEQIHQNYQLPFYNGTLRVFLYLEGIQGHHFGIFICFSELVIVSGINEDLFIEGIDTNSTKPFHISETIRFSIGSQFLKIFWRLLTVFI